MNNFFKIFLKKNPKNLFHKIVNIPLTSLVLVFYMVLEFHSDVNLFFYE